jgi:hypothetical protein
MVALPFEPLPLEDRYKAEALSAEPLGKRAKNVSGPGSENKARSARGAGRGKRVSPITLEKDQPLHVRLRYARLRRFHMQDTAAALAGDRIGRDNRKHKDRVADCLRRLTDVAHGVELRYCPDNHSAHYRGLQTCGSVWHCPVCAARISEHRRGELSRLVNAHIKAGGSVWMTTYTVSHKKYDDLEQLVAGFLAARRKMRMGRRGMALRNDFGVIGTVSVLEVTWSPRHGWHPHVHELVFSSDPDMNPDAYDAAARPAWKDAALKEGLSMNVHGFKIDRTFGAVADYIAKFGHEPASEHVWGTESEMVKGHVKQSRNEDGMTPFGLLGAVADGLEKYAPLWQEYARVFKGRKQLNYSKGLKALYGIDEETDEEIASEGETTEAVTLLELSPHEWDQVVEAHARGGLLESARSGRPGELIAALAEIDLHIEPPAMAGWRVHSPGGDGEVDEVWRDPAAPGGFWARVWLDDQAAPGGRWRGYALWDLVVLSDGSAERAKLLAEVGL